jgi:fructose-bisphosphate aldolase, class I
MVSMDRLMRNGKVFLLAYDQGLEHGPSDLNDKNADPQYIFDIAEKAEVFTCVAMQKGLADKYYQKDVYKTPLIVKLNGKTNYHKGEELFSPQNCSVEEALRLGAAGVGYTIYIGSERENESYVEFSRIVEEAHKAEIPVIMWAYPRGKHIGEAEHSPENIAYAARIALEMGADMVKLAYTGDVSSMKWVVRVAGKTKVLAVGGSKTDEEAILAKTREIVEAGVAGWAMGRNIWQDDNPIEISKKIAAILFQSNS